MKRIGWVLLTPLGLALLIFSLIGILNTFRGTPVQRVQIAGTGATRLGVADPIFRGTAELLTGARLTSGNETMYITNSYFVPDDDQRRLLTTAARRGVDVRILTAGRHTDVKSVRLAGRASYEVLLRAGVRIYEYEPSMIHSKTLVVDGLWATVGTMNFDNRSTAINEESNL